MSQRSSCIREDDVTAILLGFTFIYVKTGVASENMTGIINPECRGLTKTQTLKIQYHAFALSTTNQTIDWPDPD
jgi:hypothetical protein